MKIGYIKGIPQVTFPNDVHKLSLMIGSDSAEKRLYYYRCSIRPITAFFRTESDPVLTLNPPWCLQSTPETVPG